MVGDKRDAETALSGLVQSEREALLAFKEALSKKFGDEFLYLKIFGSRARGENQRPSDLDVLVVMRDSNCEIDQEVIRIAVQIDIKYDVLLDCHITTPSWWQEGLDRELLFYHDVEREGILI